MIHALHRSLGSLRAWVTVVMGVLALTASPSAWRSPDQPRPSTPPPPRYTRGLAPETKHRASPGHRLLGALAGGSRRSFHGPHSLAGGAASLSFLPNRRTVLSLIALLAAAALGLWLLLPGGALYAQDAGPIKYAENGTEPVLTLTGSDPEGAKTFWSLVPATGPTFPFDGNGDGDTTDDVDIAEADAADAGDFKISRDGVLSFKSPPNFESANGGQAETAEESPATGSNTYKVVVRASDGGETYAYHKVTVMVTNVEEPGTVMLSALQPQVGIALVAMHDDPDGEVIGRTWKWERSAAMDGPWTVISGDHGADPTSTYPPTGLDVGNYLRATASYTDDHQSGKMAMATTTMMVRAAPQSNDPPAFPDQDTGTPGIQTAQTRTVPEKTPPGTNIGAPVSANDGDRDTLTYTLTGTHAASFDIDPATGQLKTKAGLNFEGEESSYSVTVEVRDPSVLSTASITATDPQASAVTITVTNVDEAPSITNGSDANARNFNENLEDDKDTGDNEGLIRTFMATDPEDITTANPDRAMTWSTAGPDGSLFKITAAAITAQGDPQTASLEFKKAPDYEMPGDANKDNVYEVTVVVTDSDGMTAMRYVTIKVMDVAEGGTVTLSSQQPKVGVEFTASLEDKDGSVSSLKWKWYRSSNGDMDTPVTCVGDGADATFPGVEADPDPAIKDKDGDIITAGAYTPNLMDDAGKCLRAIASYGDGYGRDTAMKDSANPVVKDEDNRAPKFNTETTTRTVDENMVKDMNIGLAVMAMDKTAGADDVLTYTLGGADAGSFDILNGDDPDTNDVTEMAGQIRTKAKLDHESKSSYMVTVTAEDPAGLTDSIDVTIMVTDKDETPELMARSKKEQYAEKGTDPVATFTATDPEGARAIVWSLVPATGPTFPFDGNGDGDTTDDVDIAEADAADAGDFKISRDGVLSFKSPPNFESANGGQAETAEESPATGSNTYKVVVRASDGGETYAYHKVTVMVTNVEEPGTVMLSALQPQVGIALVAMHDDPDGEVIGRTWKWERSAAMDGPWTVISGDHGADPTSTYPPTGLDVGNYLRATASYTDDHQSGKMAMATTTMMVRAAPQSNDPPAFPDQDTGTPGIQTAQTRTVPEKTPPGTNIGAPVSANDGDRDTLTYTLTGTHAASFDIDPATGQLKTKAGLNFEGEESSYSVTVEVRDPSVLSTASITATDPQASAVTITVTNVDEAPSITNGSDANARNFNENLEDDKDTGDNEGLIRTFMATDPEDITTANPDRAMTWSTAGPDGSLFKITAAAITAQGDPQTASLEFKKAPDYEMPGDANKDNVYEVTVVVTDSDGMTAMRYVTIKVMDVAEGGTVTLSSQQPKVGVEFTASLEDKDGSVSSLKWKWYRSSNGDMDTPVTCVGDGADATFPGVEADPDPAIKDKDGDIITAGAYTPNLMDDAGKCLRAIASYGDGYGRDTAMKDSANPVVKDTDNRAPKFKTETTTRTMDENTPKDRNIGEPVEADDKTAGVDDTLTYSLGGRDAASFDILNGDDPDTDATEEKAGQIRTKAKLDYEAKNSYMVTVTATDGSGLSASIDVTIMVTDMDETPMIMRGGLGISGTRSVSYAENGMDAVGTYNLAGPMAASARWTLEGADAGDFMLDPTSGASVMLKFRSSPNYESASDADGDNTYMVTLKANDGEYMDTHDVTVRVTDVDETTAPAGTLLARYDADGNGEIDKSEVITAINDYLDGGEGAPTKSEVIRLINLYLDA